MTNNEINNAVAALCGPPLFVIRKPIHNPFGYYREDARGYTDNVEEAWKVTEEVAKKYVTGPAYENEPDKVIMEPAPARNYAGDLNAMHEAEKCVTLEQRRTYWQHLYRITERGRMAEPGWLTTTATARQRAEAFLRALGKWSGQ